MKPYELSFHSSDGTVIHAYKWGAETPKAPFGSVHR